MKGSVTALFCDTQLFSIKHANCTFSVVCGTYHDASLLWSVDLGFLHVAVAAPNSLPTCFCVCLLRTICTRASILVECVRCRRCHRGAELYRAGCVGEPSVRTTFCYLLLSPTLCWVDGTHSPSLWWSSCIWCASHTVWISLAEAVSHACDLCLLLLIPFFD
ncbi:putative retrotransposon hot spot protein (RHS) [Trypanosoma cruzi]|uniref:Putative retrotransposon hot spot protein (RHS) n=1 Tax=Trypanosoma cruzi TaxID=5693 RepID=A0A2V2UFZ0_TRYCR|nr:putative retrotransposon hot spot protein (RHS) [Trypanosoma cruzi]